jgi:quercetin dioxygenase-like cupin family protein
MNIVRASELAVDRSDPGVSALRLVTSERGAVGITAGVATFEPGARIVMHTHPCEETVIIIEGEAVAYVGGQRSNLSRFDSSIVPAEVPHCFANESRQPMTIAYFYPVRDARRDDLEKINSSAKGQIW